MSEVNTYTFYTTPDEVAALTGQTVTNAHCRAATALIKNYSGIQFDKIHSFTNKVYSGDGREWLDLGYYPIVAVSSVLISDTAYTDYKTPVNHGGADGFLYREYGWPEGVANIKVSFTYGHNEVPQIVRDIASRIAAIIKNEKFENIQEERLDAYSIRYAVTEGGSKNIEDQINKLLERLPKDSNITAIGQDGTSDILALNERMIRPGQ